jgi:hypothetical protein
VEALAGGWALRPALHRPFSDDGNRIDGRWETKTDGGSETDFDVVYMRVR